MKRNIGLAAACAALVTAGVAAGQDAAPPQSMPSPTPAPDIRRGGELYVAVGCYQCHGLAAHGGVAPKLGPQALPPLAMAAYIRNPNGVMPPYAASVLSDADVADITAWLRTVPESPDPASIPILPGADSIRAR